MSDARQVHKLITNTNHNSHHYGQQYYEEPDPQGRGTLHRYVNNSGKVVDTELVYSVGVGVGVSSGPQPPVVAPAAPPTDQPVATAPPQQQPTSDGHNWLTNQIPGSPRNGQQYYVEQSKDSSGNPGTLHIYKDGSRIFVPDPKNAPTGGMAAPGTDTPAPTGGAPAMPEDKSLPHYHIRTGSDSAQQTKTAEKFAQANNIPWLVNTDSKSSRYNQKYIAYTGHRPNGQVAVVHAYQNGDIVYIDKPWGTAEKPHYYVNNDPNSDHYGQKYVVIQKEDTTGKIVELHLYDNSKNGGKADFVVAPVGSAEQGARSAPIAATSPATTKSTTPAMTEDKNLAHYHFTYDDKPGGDHNPPMTAAAYAASHNLPWLTNNEAGSEHKGKKYIEVFGFNSNHQAGIWHWYENGDKTFMDKDWGTFEKPRYFVNNDPNSDHYGQKYIVTLSETSTGNLVEQHFYGGNSNFVDAPIGSAEASVRRASAGLQYTVAPGDTLSHIAQANGLTLDEIKKMNPQLTDPNLIHPGEKINLTDGTAMGSVAGSGNFPTRSTYESIQPVNSSVDQHTVERMQGWASTGAQIAKDPVSGVMGIVNPVSTDPTHINDNKNDHRG